MGAKEVINYNQLKSLPKLPLLKIKYSAIIDNVGGDIIKYGSKQLENKGIILSIGIASGDNVEIGPNAVYLKRIQLIGINSENTSSSQRKKYGKILLNFLKI